MAKVTIDGITVEVKDDATILEAARKAGVDIPYFCYHPYLRPAGLCRMCLVEVEGAPKLQPACVTQVRDGMVVKTDTDRVKKAREGIIEFQLLHHPLDCPYCDQAGECMLQDVTYRYGKATSRFVDEKELYPSKHYQPFIVHEQSRCILCKRCVRFTHEYMKGTDWNVYLRAAHSIIGAYEHDELADYFTCNLIEVCPVGAITSKLYRYKVRYWTLEWIKGACKECGLFCSLHYGIRDNRVYKAKHFVNSPGPWVCDKGYFGFEHLNSSERIRFTLARRENKLVREDVQMTVGAIAKTLKNYKKGEVVFILPRSISLEDARSVKAFTSLFGMEAEYRVYGEDYLPLGGNLGGLEDIENAKRILVLSGDVVNSHPLVALAVTTAISKGADVAVLSSYDSYIGERANLYVTVRPSLEEKAVLSLISNNYTEDIGITKEVFDNLRSYFNEDALILVGPRLSKSVRDLVANYAVERKLRYLVLDRSPIAHIAYSLGLYSDGIIGVLKRLRDGKVKALIICGIDLFKTVPDRELVKSALGNAEFVVYMGMFFDETARYADCFLPVTDLVEEAGTFVNIFGSQQKMERALNSLYDERPVRDWLFLIAKERGFDLDVGTVNFSLSFARPDSLVGDLAPPRIDGEFEAIVEIPFYRNFSYQEGKSILTDAIKGPRAFLSKKTMEALGVAEGDIIRIESKGLKFEYTAFEHRFLDDKTVVLDAGFDGFPVNSILDGKWICGVSIKKA